MSADAIVECPKCLSKRIGKPIRGITLQDYNAAVDEMPNQLRIFCEVYFDKGNVVLDFRAVCYDCDYSISDNRGEALITRPLRLPDA